MAAQDPAIHQPNGSHVHVPAWKKLGLKLKFARELPERSSLRSEQPKEVNDKKRKRDSPANEEAPNKKRVSFDATAKEHDGSSAKDLMKAWEAREEELWPYNLVIPDSALPKQAKSKKPRQTAAEPAVNTATSSPHSALLYLDQYHSSRADWKFSKNKETWLQKHILSLDHIPSSYDPALRSYISGLQSQAAKSRVSVVAEEAIHQDQEQKPEENSTTTIEQGGMEDPVLRQKYYESALARYKRQLEESIDREIEEEEQERLDEKSRRRLAKRKRAEMVMWSVSATEQPESSPHNGFKRVKLDPKEAEDVKKKRKNRTSVVEISSSEEESAISSDSDSDSDGGSESNSASASGSDSDAESESGDDDSDASDDSSPADSSSEPTSPQSNSRPSSQSRTEEETTSESGSSDDGTSSGEEESPKNTRGAP